MAHNDSLQQGIKTLHTSCLMCENTAYSMTVVKAAH